MNTVLRGDLEEVFTANSDLIGTVDRKHIKLPVGTAQSCRSQRRWNRRSETRPFSKTVYALIADESVYVFALCVNEEQAEANSPLFQAIIRSLEIPE
jgi:hypothetical protein